MSVRILTGDARDRLKELPGESVHCVCTSPPYFGLRDYGTAKWEGGDAACDHLGEPFRTSANINANWDGGNDVKNKEKRQPFKDSCGKCGARRIDSQIGLEPTPDQYVAELVAVFREVRRVLRKDGTLWLNLGDSYANDGKWGGHTGGKHVNALHCSPIGRNKRYTGLKPKDIIGIPWMVAFALRSDGWWLRQDIIWSKPNPMPESVTDRCTKAHEYLFMLAKSERYYFDQDAIRHEPTGRTDPIRHFGKHPDAASHTPNYELDALKGRNKRSVWTVSTQPFPEAHFATFPPDLIEPCIKAGTSEKGCCAACGAPWRRETERTTEFHGGSGKAGRTAEEVNANGKWAGQQYGTNIKLGPVVSTRTTGWSLSCSCDAVDDAPRFVVPCTVLDPFGGAGTTGLVADRLGRNAILIELNPAYAEMSRRRIVDDAPLFAEAAE